MFYVHNDDDGERAPGAGNPMFSYKPGVVFGSQKTLELRCVWYTFIGVLSPLLLPICGFFFMLPFLGLCACAFKLFASLTICIEWIFAVVVVVFVVIVAVAVRYFALSIRAQIYV